MRSGVRLVLWDWLGTLCSNDVLAHSRFVDLKFRGFVPEDLDWKDLSDSNLFQVKNFLKRYPYHKISATWFLVDRFTQSGVFQVVVSNGLRSSILPYLDAYNPFEMLLTSEEFEPKPALEMPLHAMRSLGVSDMSEIILIGDSLVDEATAKALKIRFFKIGEYYQSAYSIAKDLCLF